MDKESTLQKLKSLIKDETSAEDLAIIEEVTKEVEEVFNKEEKATSDYALLRDKFVKNIVEGNFGSGEPVEAQVTEPRSDEDIIKDVLSRSRDQNKF